MKSERLVVRSKSNYQTDIIEWPDHKIKVSVCDRLIALTLLLPIKHKQEQTKQEFGQGHLLCSNVLQNT